MYTYIHTYLPVDPMIKRFFMCVFCIHTTWRCRYHLVMYSIYVLTHDQKISGNVLFHPMGNTSPLGYLPSLKSGRSESLLTAYRILSGSNCVRLLLTTWLLVLVGITYNYQSWQLTFNKKSYWFLHIACPIYITTWSIFRIHSLMYW